MSVEIYNKQDQIVGLKLVTVDRSRKYFVVQLSKNFELTLL
jgi:hypothetical protein